MRFLVASLVAVWPAWAGLVGAGAVRADEPVSGPSAGVTPPPVEVHLPPQKWALLVGVNDYTHFADLEFCDADVEGLKEKLVDAAFPEDHVTVLRDGAARKHLLPFKSNIQRQMQLLLATVRPQDLVVVAFSGHGLNINGTSYLCPIEAHFSDPNGTMVSLDSVYQMLQQSPARQKLLLVDACRNDPTPPGIKGPATRQSADQFARSLEENPPQGILLLTSCRAGQRSVEDPEFGHGVFMYFLMKALEGEADVDQNGKVSVLELYMYAELKTKTYVRQVANVVQTPTLKGEFSGVYDVATVRRRASPAGEAKAGSPAAVSPKQTQPQPGVSAATSSTPVPPIPPPATNSGFKAAVNQADEFFRQGKLEEAVNAYSALILIDGTRKELHLKRGSVHLAKGDIEKAVIDYQLGGKPLPLTVVASGANLQKGSRITANVKQGQTLSVTKVTRFSGRDWLWVAAVDGNDAARGWILKDAVRRPAQKSRDHIRLDVDRPWQYQPDYQQRRPVQDQRRPFLRRWPKSPR